MLRTCAKHDLRRPRAEERPGVRCPASAPSAAVEGCAQETRASSDEHEPGAVSGPPASCPADAGAWGGPGGGDTRRAVIREAHDQVEVVASATEPQTRPRATALLQETGRRPGALGAADAATQPAASRAHRSGLGIAAQPGCARPWRDRVARPSGGAGLLPQHLRRRGPGPRVRGRVRRVVVPDDVSQRRAWVLGALGQAPEPCRAGRRRAVSRAVAAGRCTRRHGWHLLRLDFRPWDARAKGGAPFRRLLAARPVRRDARKGGPRHGRRRRRRGEAWACFRGRRCPTAPGAVAQAPWAHPGQRPSRSKPRGRCLQQVCRGGLGPQRWVHDCQTRGRHRGGQSVRRSRGRRLERGL